MSLWLTVEDFAAIALADGVREVAISDAFENFQGFDGSVREFLKHIKPDRPHWWASAPIDTPDNAALYSLAAQGAYVHEHGEAAARSMLAAEGLKLGQVRAAPKPDHGGKNNPYSLRADDPKRQERIIALIKSSATLAASLAKSAGCRIDGSAIPKR